MTTYPCPACGAPADLTAGCGNCGRAPDPRAAEVVRLNAELGALAPRMRQALDAYQALSREFLVLRQRRDDLAAQVRHSVAVARAGNVTVAPPPAAAPPRPPTVRPEARPVTVQNLLFVLGGLLVGAAAIVFTGVAWATYGAVGRSVALGGVTLLALAVPPLAARRGLRGTAETFAAIAMLLVVLDGYGAWYVDLFGLGSVPGAGYAAGVCAVTAAVGVGYGLATGLSAPRLAALVAIQPTAPLLAAEWGAGIRGWSLAFTAVAVANLVVVRLAGRPVRVPAWVLYGCAQVLSAASALVALLVPGPLASPALVGGPALLSAAALLSAGWLNGRAPLRAVAAALALLAAGGAVYRPLRDVAPSGSLVLAAATVLALAVAARLLRSLPAASAPSGPAESATQPAAAPAAPAAAPAPAPASPPAPAPAPASAPAPAPAFAPTSVPGAGHAGGGPRPEALGAGVGATVAAALLAPIVAVLVMANAAGSLGASLPAWRGGSGNAPYDWQVPVAVLLATAAVLLVVPAAWRRGLALAGGAAALLGLPALWWALAPLELAAAAALVLVLARWAPAVTGPAAAVLAAHALGVSLIRPWSATAALGALVAIGVAALATGERTTVDGRGGAANGAGIVRRAAFATGLVAFPGAAACAVFAAGAGQPWPARAGLVAAALLLLPVAVLGGRAARPYAVTALAVAVTGTTLVPDLAGGGDARGLYPALGLVVLATGYRAVRPGGLVPLGTASLFHGSALLAVLIPLSYVLLVEPYRWLAQIWSGAPDRIEEALPSGGPAAVLLVAAALLLIGRYRAAAFTGVAGLVAVAAALEAPWPVVPAALLALGTALVLAVSLRGGGRAWGVPLGSLVAAPGLAGLLPTEAATLAGLGFVAVAAAVVGAAGATAAARIGGWLAAATAGGALAVASTLAAGLPLGRAAYPVLGVAALALGLAALLRRWPAKRVERVAVDAAAHAIAAVALLLTIVDARHAAALCTLWGAAVAVRAVAPGETARRGLAFVSGSSVLLAWWMLLVAERVALTEAYTLPAALLALVAGHVALRARPGIGSWVGYGPGLAVALLPSLASILVADGQGVRRLLLGLGALLAVLAGAYEKRQAPLVVGGAVLLVVTVHEVLVWDLLPRWAYLAIGGLVLIAVAMTYERRLRDLRRLRGAITRMT